MYPDVPWYIVMVNGRFGGFFIGSSQCACQLPNIFDAMVRGDKLRRSSAQRRNDILAAEEEERLKKQKIANHAYPKTITFANKPDNNNDMSVITTASSFHSNNDGNYDDSMSMCCHYEWN